MSTQSMLAFPLAHHVLTNEAISQIAKLLRRSNGRAGATLQYAVATLLGEVLVAAARQSRGDEVEKDRLFCLGVFLVADDLAEEALSFIENELLLPLCDFDGSDRLYDDIKKLAIRAVQDGGHSAGALWNR